MGSIRRRLDRLEEKSGYQRTPLAGSQPDPGAERERVVDEFINRALEAMASIKRGDVDPDPCRYSLQKLEGEGPMTVAAHVAALAWLEHEDEAGAHEILSDKMRQRGLAPVPLEMLIDTFTDPATSPLDT